MPRGNLLRTGHVLRLFPSIPRPNLPQVCVAGTVFVAYLIPSVQHLPVAISGSNELWTSECIILVRVLPTVGKDHCYPQLPLKNTFHLSALKGAGERESIARSLRDNVSIQRD